MALINKQITDSDKFCDLPATVQALYFHLVINADDKGFTNAAKSIARSLSASPADFEMLVSKGFAEVSEDSLLVRLVI